MGPGDLQLRASDAERQAVVDALGAHFVDGRLTMEEHSDRLALAMSARTRGDLAALTADLPAAAGTAAPATPVPDGPSMWARAGRRFGPFLVPSGICTVVWAFTGHGYFWPEWVMLGTGISVLRGRRRRHEGHAHAHGDQGHVAAGHAARVLAPPPVVRFDPLGAITDPAVRRLADPLGLFGDPDVAGRADGPPAHGHRSRHDDRSPGDRTARDRAARGPSLGGPVGRRPERAPATLAFVDVVGSTAHARRLGDRRWAELLGALMDGADRALAAEAGDLVFHRGDEVVGAFAGPSAAVRWALAVRDHAHRVGLQVRAGLHAGEVERVNGTYTGVALHLGQRASTVAAPDEVLVTSTVADLLAGSEVRLLDRGTHVLKGFDEPWRLFAVDA